MISSIAPVIVQSPVRGEVLTPHVMRPMEMAVTPERSRIGIPNGPPLTASTWAPATLSALLAIQEQAATG